MDAFAAGLEDIAAAITRRDAEARASSKRPLPVPVCARQQRLEGLQHRFKMWCANDLHGAVRAASGGPAGRIPDEPYPGATEKTLDAGYARLLVLTFGAQAMQVPQAHGIAAPAEMIRAGNPAQ